MGVAGSMVVWVAALNMDSKKSGSNIVGHNFA